MAKAPYNKYAVLLVNGKQLYKGHFDTCITIAGGYPGEYIEIKPKQK